MTFSISSELTGKNFTKKEYREYLKTPKWKELREEAYRRAGFACDACGNRCALRTHHKRYPDTLGAETQEDLMVLCATCHKKIHLAMQRAKDNPATESSLGLNGEVKVYSRAEIKKYQKNLTK